MTAGVIAATRPEHPPELPESYHRVHRAYGVFSALLMGWELVGIRLPPEPFADVNIILESPQAAPWILLVLVSYFAFRLSIEWAQAHPLRRALRPAAIDYGVAHLIGSVSVALFAYQRLSGLQLADRLSFRLGSFDFHEGAAILFALIGFVGTSVTLFATDPGNPRTPAKDGPGLSKVERGCALTFLLSMIAAMALSFAVGGSALFNQVSISAAAGLAAGIVASFVTVGQHLGDMARDRADYEQMKREVEEMKNGGT